MSTKLRRLATISMVSHKVNLLDVASTELVSATSGVNDPSAKQDFGP